MQFMPASISIVLAPDDNYAQHAGVLMASIVANASSNSKVSFYILCDNISEENKRKLSEIDAGKPYEVNFIHINPDDFEGFPASDYITVSTWYRMKSSTLLPAEVSRALYLDCDIIVNSPLDEIFEMDFEDNYAMVVLDCWWKKFNKRCGFEKNFKYFNAGVIMMNLDKWREDKIEEKIFSFLKDDPKRLEMLDQTVLNTLLAGRVKMLKMKWNMQYTPAYLEESCLWGLKKEYAQAYRNPSILHYVNDYKPWRAGAGAINKWQSLYFKYLKMTPWRFESEIKEIEFLKKNKDLKKSFWIKRFFRKIRRKPWCVFRSDYWGNIKLHRYIKANKNKDL